jgi:primosomal replication protein N
MNRTVLCAQLVQRGPARYTPAGIPACDCQLNHASQTSEAGQVRQVSLEIKAIAFGGIAQQLLQLELGSSATYAGFLTNGRNGRGTVFHVTELA